jgi:uncharacterized protein (DUF2249 family)
MAEQNDVVIASDRADAEAAERVVAHHAEMAGRVAALVGTLARTDSAEAAIEARNRLVTWAREELLPHAAAEEDTLYGAGGQLSELRLLVRAMVAEHERITALVEALAQAETPAAAVAAAGGLEAVLDVHLHKENELLLPALVEAPSVSVAGLLTGMHEILGADETAPTTSGCGGHTCACGESETAELPELDARAVPHAIRHATIFGALDALGPGGGLVLVAPHDPLPLLDQLEARSPGAFAVDYLERGPEAWRLRLVRRA